MKKVLILTVFAIFMVSCKGSIVQLTAVPDFGDGENNQSDDDSPLTDHDSPVTDDDSGNTGNTGDTVPDDDSPFTDHDSPVTDDDVITCTEGELRCSSEDFDVEECDGGKWVTKEECGEGWICDDSVDPIVCADQICFPGARYCKMGDVYECASNGLSEEMTENCTDTQYCDEGDDPGECRDMVCVPNENFCETNILKECNEEGSASSTLKECGTGVCDETLENCVFTDEVGGIATSGSGNNRMRGVYYSCTKNVKIIEISMYLNLNTAGDINFVVYGNGGNGTTYTKLFEKTVSFSADGSKFYSTGTIAFDLNSGHKYMIGTSWSQSVGYFSTSGLFPDDVSFGSATSGFILNSYPAPNSFNENSSSFSYSQKIKTVDK